MENYILKDGINNKENFNKHIDFINIVLYNNNIKGGIRPMKKAFNTSIDEEILEQFREKCKEEKLPINVVLERFMQGYINEDFKLEMKYFYNGK